MDRRLIMVELPPSQAGIAAALRRAFQTAKVANEEPDDGFGRLLSQIN